MVLGLRTKTRRSPLVPLDYVIHIQEIKPWPPSQSLRTLRSVLIQWDHGDKNSGSTNQAVPSLGTGTGVGDGRIEFNESFRLTFTLTREMSIKGGEETFQKNCIEFNLYEPRRDKTVKGQLLGTAVLDLADCGIVKETLNITAPINCKRTYRNTVQPLLFLNIQPSERRRLSSSSRDSLLREASMDRSHAESVSALMSEEYAEEAEVASFTTEDDVSSHSSQALASSTGESNGSASPHNNENRAVTGATLDHDTDQFVAKSDQEQVTETYVNSSRSSSIDLSSDLAWFSKKITSPCLQSITSEDMEKQSNSNTESYEHETETKHTKKIAEKFLSSSKAGLLTRPFTKDTLEGLDDPKDVQIVSVLSDQQDDGNASSPGKEDLIKIGRIYSPRNGVTDESKEKQQKNAEEERIVEENGHQIENEQSSYLSQIDAQKNVPLDDSMVFAAKGNYIVSNSFSDIDRPKNGKSVRSLLDSSRSTASVSSNQFFVPDAHNKALTFITSERKETKLHTRETRNLLSDSRIQHLEHRIKALEGELKEAATSEASLYSVVAEHGSSMTKVHAPARRLSRLYFHASKQTTKSRKASAARSVVSGLVLVAKACGNDVPRLTFWLSNSIALRVIISKSCGDCQLPISAGPVSGNGNKKSSPLKWESFTSKSERTALELSFGDWEKPHIFVAALEKVESWIFSRIIESIWWQTFTPHMQSGAAKAIRSSMDSDSCKLFRRTSSSTDQQQGNYSLELWKKAFTDACERICPVRAGGHDCGCLPVLSRLIMEQLVARLDVAMLNAILRESADDIPTDPVADPISDVEVLPIPSGKASFGAGAQLKNAIGNWSRWLTDLFGIDDDDELLEIENRPETADDDDQISRDTSLKPFHLLNALSDLMMLPKDMLLSRTIRKEVCPTFGPPLIRRVLISFIPDEFCPDPVPGVVMEALNSEDTFDSEEDSIIDFPCAAAPIVYQPPPVASVGIFGEIGNHPQLTRSVSSVLNKSQTSDDELDQLDSPLQSIMPEGLQASPSSSSVKPGWISHKSRSVNAVRYRLLREVWMDSE